MSRVFGRGRQVSIDREGKVPHLEATELGGFSFSVATCPAQYPEACRRHESRSCSPDLARQPAGI